MKTRIEVQRARDDYSHVGNGDVFDTLVVFEAEGTFSLVASDSNLKIRMTVVEEHSW
jgi:hypothetical protein